MFIEYVIDGFTDRHSDTQMLSEESVRQSYETFFRESGELDEGTN